jgi:hypothetical protein
MANGWAPDGAVREQIQDSLKDALASARARMPSGERLSDCEDCAVQLPEARPLSPSLCRVVARALSASRSASGFTLR